MCAASAIISLVDVVCLVFVSCPAFACPNFFHVPPPPPRRSEYFPMRLFPCARPQMCRTRDAPCNCVSPSTSGRVVVMFMGFCRGDVHKVSAPMCVGKSSNIVHMYTQISCYMCILNISDICLTLHVLACEYVRSCARKVTITCICC